MKSLRNLYILLLVTGLGLISSVQSQEIPKTMARVTIKIVEPIPEPGSFASESKTMWRAGTGYARIAEAPDLEKRIHILAIIHEPDVWIINLLDKTGKHVIDPGPNYDVHIPIFEESGVKTKLSELEIGKELEFFVKNGARESPGEMMDGKTTICYELIISDGTVALWVDIKSRKPVRINRIQGVKRQTIAFVAYDDVLAFDPTLFRPPAEIKILDSK
jgi:hypothetical protein